jgi:D-beta-D-heptose 7-phosphate kinase/D-beta-D-heptose 1-phosphate adenosyltransferase
VVGRNEIRQWGGRVTIVPEVAGKSTTNIVDRVLSVYR